MVTNGEEGGQREGMYTYDKQHIHAVTSHLAAAGGCTEAAADTPETQPQHAACSAFTNPTATSWVLLVGMYAVLLPGLRYTAGPMQCTPGQSLHSHMQEPHTLHLCIGQHWTGHRVLWILLMNHHASHHHHQPMISRVLHKVLGALIKHTVPLCPRHER